MISARAIVIHLPKFNLVEANIKAENFFKFSREVAIAAWQNHQYMSWDFVVFHSELPETPVGYKYPGYHYAEAKMRFPFLFAGSETNLILYRRFKL
jgi:hypothetical protein